MAEWSFPELKVGDAVLWHSNPQNLNETPALGWVIERPGTQTVSVLVFTQSTGFIEKKSVRHADDPFWRESETANNWQQWGCFTLHPVTEVMPVLKEMISDWKISRARREKAAK